MKYNGQNPIFYNRERKKGSGVFFRVPKYRNTEKEQCNREFMAYAETGFPVPA